MRQKVGILPTVRGLELIALYLFVMRFVTISNKKTSDAYRIVRDQLLHVPPRVRATTH